MNGATPMDVTEASPPTSSGQHQVLSELDRLQERVIESMQLASEALQTLSVREELDQQDIQDKYEAYLAIMRDVFEGLASRASWVKNYVPYHRNTEALRTEVDILQMKLDHIKSEALSMGVNVS